MPKRADKTLHDRANSLFMYIRYMKSVDTPSSPLSADKVYNFVESCRIEGAAASRAASVKKALNAATRILGLHNDIRAFDIETIDGSVARHMKKKTPDAAVKSFVSWRCHGAGKGYRPF